MPPPCAPAERAERRGLSVPAVGIAAFVLTFLLAKALDGARMVNHPGGEQPPSCQPAGCGGRGGHPAAWPGPARHGLDCRAVEGEGMAGGVGRGGNAVPEAARGGRRAGVCPSGEGDRRDRLRGPFRGGALAPGLSPSWLCYSHCLPASLLEDVRCSSWGEGQRNKNCTSFTQ